jgi:hypothetical protein
VTLGEWRDLLHFTEMVLQPSSAAGYGPVAVVTGLCGSVCSSMCVPVCSCLRHLIGQVLACGLAAGALHHDAAQRVCTG